jgi:ATP-dependent RNA helicase DDX5/DBP2
MAGNREQYSNRGGYNNYGNGGAYNGGGGYGKRQDGGGYGGGGYGGGGGGRDGFNGGAGSRLKTVDFKRQNLMPIQKDFYKEHSTVTRRSQMEIDQWITENQVALTGIDVPRPVFEFNEVGYEDAVVNLLYGNYKQPTVIQSISWPVALSGRDIVSIARTGSGKTLGV